MFIKNERANLEGRSLAVNMKGALRSAVRDSKHLYTVGGNCVSAQSVTCSLSPKSQPTLSGTNTCKRQSGDSAADRRALQAHPVRGMQSDTHTHTQREANLTAVNNKTHYAIC